jgi:hypothetical protein
MAACVGHFPVLATVAVGTSLPPLQWCAGTTVHPPSTGGMGLAGGVVVLFTDGMAGQALKAVRTGGSDRGVGVVNSQSCRGVSGADFHAAKV